MLKPLISLFVRSFQAWKSSIKPILVGSLVIAVAIGITYGVFYYKIQSNVSVLVEKANLEPERMAELTNRIQRGDEAALDEMMEDVGFALATVSSDNSLTE